MSPYSPHERALGCLTMASLAVVALCVVSFLLTGCGDTDTDGDGDTDSDTQVDADIECAPVCATATCPDYQACSEYFPDGSFRSWLESGDGVTWDCTDDACMGAINQATAYCGACI